jgi:hypothetical protein
MGFLSKAKYSCLSGDVLKLRRDDYFEPATPLYMDGSDQWHTMYKTKLVIPSTQTDILPQHKLFLCGYAGLNCGISLTVHRIGIELYTSLMTFKTFSTIQ